MYETVTGSKYDRSLTKVQIAALVRAEIKTALKIGAIPAGTKVSLVCRPGSSIDATITAFPGYVVQPSFVLAQRAFDTWPHVPPFIARGGTDRYSTAFAAVVKLIEGMFSAYNTDSSDIASDYFNTNFYFNVLLCSDLERSQTTALLTEKKEFIDDLKVSLISKGLEGEQRANAIGDACRSEAA